MNKEFKRLQELAGIKEIQVSPPKTYYAILYIGDNNFYIISYSKESMIDQLNKIYKEISGALSNPYSLEDMDEDARMYMGTRFDSYISDDFALVTDDKQYFDKNVSYLETPPKRYQSSTGINEIIIRGNAQVYKSTPDQGLYKVKNFPVVDPQDILSNSYFIKILDKILKDSYDESLAQYMEDYRTDDDKEYIIKQIASYISELKSLQTVYVYPDGGGEISIYDSLEHFSEGYRTEEDWEVEDWEQI
jgi:hypothetical protein